MLAFLGTCDKARDRGNVGGMKATWVGVDVTPFQSSARCGGVKGDRNMETNQKKRIFTNTANVVNTNQTRAWYSYSVMYN